MKNNNMVLNEIEVIKIDKRILPLFSSSIMVKNRSEMKRSKYNLNNLNPQKKLTYDIITLDQILEVILKGMNLYNFNLNNFILKQKKLALISKFKKNESYNLNLQISKFIYLIDKILPIFKIKSLLYNIRLFSPNHLLKPESKIRYSYRLRNIIKIYLSIFKRERKINRRKINKILLKGNEIITKLDSQITLKKNILKNIKAKVNNSLINVDNSFSVVQESRPAILLENTNFLTQNPEIQINEIKLKNQILKLINKSNELKIEQEMNSNLKKNNFDCKTDSISVNSNPVSLSYVEDGNKPILNQYLKTMSIYNRKTNGIFIFYSNIIGFNFNTETSKLIKNIYNLLAALFKSMYCLISKPVFVITPDKIIIQLFYYLFLPSFLRPTLYGKRKRYSRGISRFRRLNFDLRIKIIKLANQALTKVFPDKFKKLCEILSHLLKKPVELDLIRLHYPYKDSNILANFLGIMINRVKLRIIFKTLFKNAVVKTLKNNTNKNRVNIIPAYLSGLTIKVAGRLMTQKIIPRKTIKITQRGALAKGKINFSDVARYTNKNKRGIFSITVSAGQNFS
uniref:ribosomal protein S3 n=1 Tax=Leucopaxillus giganteus TaxID=1167592 RepID=UPI00315C73BC